MSINISVLISTAPICRSGRNKAAYYPIGVEHSARSSDTFQSFSQMQVEVVDDCSENNEAETIVKEVCPNR
jgi:hypothetical protein